MSKTNNIPRDSRGRFLPRPRAVAAPHYTDSDVARACAAAVDAYRDARRARRSVLLHAVAYVAAPAAALLWLVA